jgi:hypothetical protein
VLLSVKYSGLLEQLIHFQIFFYAASIRYFLFRYVCGLPYPGNRYSSYYHSLRAGRVDQDVASRGLEVAAKLIGKEKKNVSFNV